MSVLGFTTLVGTLYLFYLSLKFLRFLLDVLKTSLLGESIDFTKFGAWAVVTGCTDGIGKEYAKQLAGKGLNIVLMSRTQEKLEAVASEIEKEHQVETKIIQIDFSGGSEIYIKVAKELEGLEIGVLVNNVGASLSYPEYFANTTIEDVTKQINVNVLSMTMMMRLVLPAMIERKKGVIINVSSVAGDIISPMLSEYSATKTYMDKLSANLHAEYAEKGIIIQSVLPLFVATKMSGIKKASLFAPFPADYVSAVLRKVGASKKCYGYWPHELQACVATSLPQWFVIKYTLSQMAIYRARALRKQKEKSS